MSPTFGKKSRITPGWPDITFAYYGIACCWEVKFGAGEQTPEQRKLMAELLAPPNHWRYEIVRSVEQAKQILDALENEALQK